MIDPISIPEAAPYLSQSPPMRVGTTGKNGVLRLGFELDGEGKSILRKLYRQTPLIVQQALYFDSQMPQMPCVYILSSGGPNVDGDRYEQSFKVEANAMAHISTGAATKLAEMNFNCSMLDQRFDIEQGGYMEYLPEMIIPCRHTRFIAHTEIVIDRSATLFYSEIYASGRKHSGEEFEYDLLSVTTHATDRKGEELFGDKFVIRPHKTDIRQTGVVGHYSVFGCAIVLTPPQSADEIYGATDSFSTDSLAAGITRLPNNCGLIYKVLGMESTPVKKAIRAFCSTVRQTVKGHSLPEEFVWRQ